MGALHLPEEWEHLSPQEVEERLKIAITEEYSAMIERPLEEIAAFRRYERVLEGNGFPNSRKSLETSGPFFRSRAPSLSLLKDMLYGLPFRQLVQDPETKNLSLKYEHDPVYHHYMQNQYLNMEEAFMWNFAQWQRQKMTSKEISRHVQEFLDHYYSFYNRSFYDKGAPHGMRGAVSLKGSHIIAALHLMYCRFQGVDEVTRCLKEYADWAETPNMKHKPAINQAEAMQKAFTDTLRVRERIQNFFGNFVSFEDAAIDETTFVQHYGKSLPEETFKGQALLETYGEIFDDRIKTEMQIREDMQVMRRFTNQDQVHCVVEFRNKPLYVYFSDSFKEAGLDFGALGASGVLFSLKPLSPEEFDSLMGLDIKQLQARSDVLMCSLHPAFGTIMLNNQVLLQKQESDQVFYIPLSMMLNSFPGGTLILEEWAAVMDTIIHKELGKHLAAGKVSMEEKVLHIEDYRNVINKGVRRLTGQLPELPVIVEQKEVQQDAMSEILGMPTKDILMLPSGALYRVKSQALQDALKNGATKVPQETLKEGSEKLDAPSGDFSTNDIRKFVTRGPGQAGVFATEKIRQMGSSHGVYRRFYEKNGSTVAATTLIADSVTDVKYDIISQLHFNKAAFLHLLLNSGRLSLAEAFAGGGFGGAEDVG